MAWFPGDIFSFSGMSFYLHLTSRKNPPICVSSWQSIFCFLTFPLHKYPFIIHPPSWIDGFFPEEKQKIPCLCPTLPPKTNQKTCPLNLWNYRFFPIPQPKKIPVSIQNDQTGNSSWPFWDGDSSWPPTFGDKKRSRRLNHLPSRFCFLPVVPQLWKQRYLAKRCLVPPDSWVQRGTGKVDRS